ncbi:FAD-dependent monooxygenase [Streptomyces albulus]|nr:FAD-dependent monooxygenase [Streptomyces noursei]
MHLPQHALTRALRAALAGEPLARIVHDSRLAAVEQDDKGVSAQTRGDNGTWWRGSYLVGCDGPRSTVRKLLDVRFPGRTAVERHAVATLRTELPGPTRRCCTAPRPGTGRPGQRGVRPAAARRGLAAGLAAAPGRELVTPDALVARIRDSLAGWAAEAADGSADEGAAGGRPHTGLVPPYELLDTGVHTVHHRLARTWRRGRAFLAGDAAHLLGALGTQGLDEGLRDAENLAWKLGLAWHHGATEDLLDSYQIERRGAVAARLRAADSALPLLRDGGAVRWRTVLPGAARGRSTLLTDGHLGRSPLGAAPTYPRTPLAAPTDCPARRRSAPSGGTGGGRAGDRLRRCVGGAARPARARAVGGAGGARHRVWDRRHWQSAGLMPRLTDAVGALPMRAEILVTEAYPGAAAHTVLVVRPDGHLVAALSGVRPDELAACAEAVRGRADGAAGRRPTADVPAQGGGPLDAVAEPVGDAVPVDPPGSSVLHSEGD